MRERCACVCVCPENDMQHLDSARWKVGKDGNYSFVPVGGDHSLCRRSQTESDAQCVCACVCACATARTRLRTCVCACANVYVWLHRDVYHTFFHNITCTFFLPGAGAYYCLTSVSCFFHAGVLISQAAARSHSAESACRARGPKWKIRSSQ